MKLNHQNQLKDIYYISIPDTFKLSPETFKIDKDIKLPIETDGLDKWDSESITLEKIISAMLKIMVYDSDNNKIDYYRDFIKSVRPSIIEELTDSAIFKSNVKEFKLAKEIFLAINGLEPQNDMNLLNLAILYEDESDWYKSKEDIKTQEELLSDAMEIYNELLAKESVLTDVYFNAGYFFIKVKNFDKAEICLKSFIEYSNNEDKISRAKKLLSEYKSILSNESILNKAYSLILNEKESEAINIIADFLIDNKNIWNGWFLLGWANRRLSNFSEAISALEKAISLNEKDTDTFNEIAICYMEMGDYTKSEKFLKKALSISPEDVKIISNMGIIELKKGNSDEAIRFFETVLVYEPNDSIARHYLDNIN